MGSIQILSYTLDHIQNSFFRKEEKLGSRPTASDISCPSNKTRHSDVPVCARMFFSFIYDTFWSYKYFQIALS